MNDIFKVIFLSIEALIFSHHPLHLKNLKMMVHIKQCGFLELYL